MVVERKRVRLGREVTDDEFASEIDDREVVEID